MVNISTRKVPCRILLDTATANEIHSVLYRPWLYRLRLNRRNSRRSYQTLMQAKGGAFFLWIEKAGKEESIKYLTTEKAHKFLYRHPASAATLQQLGVNHWRCG
jgi:hypothetical protein